MLRNTSTYPVNQHPITKHVNWFGVPRFWRKIFIISIIALVVEAGVVFAITRSPLVSNNLCIGNDQKTCVVKAELAEDPESLEKGLGNRALLGKDQGMLLVFPTPTTHCIWMKDMHFPLDILWLDIDKKVVHSEQNVSPDSYPATFCPQVDAKYILEINAGDAAKHSLTKGTKLTF